MFTRVTPFDVWQPRETAKRNNVVATRLTDEELAAVNWLAERLAEETGGKHLPPDVIRIALGLYYERRQGERTAPKKEALGVVAR